jgi:hypothetical protein
MTAQQTADSAGSVLTKILQRDVRCRLSDLGWCPLRIHNLVHSRMAESLYRGSTRGP